MLMHVETRSGCRMEKFKRMISTEAATGNSNLRRPVLPFQNGTNSIQYVTFILHVSPDARSWMHALVVQTLSIDAIHAEHLQSAGFYLGDNVRIIPVSSYSK
jgi:hypothetical protein